MMIFQFIETTPVLLVYENNRSIELRRRLCGDTFRAWRWNQDLYRELLSVTGVKERIRHFIGHYDAKGVPTENLDEFIRSLHAGKKTAIDLEAIAGLFESSCAARILPGEQVM